MSSCEDRVAEPADRGPLERAMNEDNLNASMPGLIEQSSELEGELARAKRATLVVRGNDIDAAASDSRQHRVIATASSLSAGDVQVCEDVDLVALAHVRKRATCRL